MKLILCIPLLFSYCVLIAQSTSIGIFDNHADVGNPQIAGSAQYDEATQTYTLTGAGYNIWFERDEFQYLYKNLSGDFILTAHFELVGEGGDPHRKVGWMVRESLAENAAHISAVTHDDGLTVLQWRALPGALMRDPQDEIFAPKDNYSILQLERMGSTFTMRAAHPGEPLQLIGSHDMEDLPDNLLAGLIITSHDESTTEEAKVWNVRIDKPIVNTLTADNEMSVGSRLETMNVLDGKRKVVFESSGRIEFPTWTPDEQKLLFSMDRSLYTIPATGGTPQKFETDSLDGNHYDFGISPDGKMLAITSSTDGIEHRVYVLPMEGGTARRLTEQSPSYWHGWSANGKEVYFVAQRDTNMYNIYKKPLKGGDEIQLTSVESGYTDGPEESPDGKYMYYNSNKSGTMQLWRMKPDGTDPEQLTFDEYNDWFPHISPDGKWIAFLSYGSDVPSDAHPNYDRVSIRLMPASGGVPRVIANLYGGQGSFNVPSWSPDSQQIALVSYTGMSAEELSTSTR
ncbi:MAG: hypothetical protein RIG62_30575 [Cyclobacteriaceae bacterium]